MGISQYMYEYITFPLFLRQLIRASINNEGGLSTVGHKTNTT